MLSEREKIVGFLLDISHQSPRIRENKSSLPVRLQLSKYRLHEYSYGSFLLLLSCDPYNVLL
jgi:hypothetical protein